MILKGKNTTIPLLPLDSRLHGLGVGQSSGMLISRASSVAGIPDIPEH